MPVELKVVDGGLLESGLNTVPDEELRQKIKDLKHTIDRGYFELAGLLMRAYSTGVFRNWGFATWKEYIEEDLEMSLRKAQYLMSIWQWFEKTVDDPAVKEKVEHLGWGKLKSLAGIVDESNVDDWVDRAEHMTSLELAESARRAKAGDPNQDVQITTISFGLYREQHENVERALAMAQDMANSDKRGHLLDLICTSFISETLFQKGPTQKLANLYLEKLGRILGMRLVGWNANTGDLLMGADFLENWLQDMASDDK